jgi:predicted Zn-dependent protease
MMSGRLEDLRILSKAECEAIAAKLAAFATGGGATLPMITSWWQGELRWGRNRVTLSSDRRDLEIRMVREVNGIRGRPVMVNQLDEGSLKAVVRAAERAAAFTNEKVSAGLSFEPPVPDLPMPRPAIWSDATFNLTAKARGTAARSLIQTAEAQGLLSAGYIEVRAGVRFYLLNGTPYYWPFTQAQCSMTVRDPQGTGSGWAGGSSYDWTRINVPALARRALDKCVASRNPVALEPGRYTVILEPQAVADLIEPMVSIMERPKQESDTEPFGLDSGGAAKFGLKVADPRITLSHDPADPELGVVPLPGQQPVTWIDKGVLTALGYERAYGLQLLHKNPPVMSPAVGYRMSGGTASLEEIIATTGRGILVTRFSGVKNVQGSEARRSLLCTGLTRDGLWLIENGKISKPIKNFRFTESPLFMLNQLEQVGVSEPVFRPVKTMDRDARGDPHAPDLTPAIVPPLRARDFSFTAMADAV